jgi:hypothetical protein
VHGSVGEADLVQFTGKSVRQIQCTAWWHRRTRCGEVEVGGSGAVNATIGEAVLVD